jgi:predicted nucleic acid-binding protein
VAYDELIAHFTYAPYRRSTWNRAAEFWAESRLRGAPIADADVIIAAQAYHLGVVLVTRNRRHFAPFVPLGLQIEDWTK